MAMTIRPELVTNVRLQLKQQAMISAVNITEMACIKVVRRSEMPFWRILAVMVMMAAVCPGGSASSTEIGCLNNESR